MQTTRILVAIDVDSTALAAEYNGGFDHTDLAASVVARLDEFYPNNGYIVPTAVTAVVVEDNSPVTRIHEADLRGVYEVGVEGVQPF